jgi:hypothetical protein
LLVFLCLLINRNIWDSTSVLYFFKPFRPKRGSGLSAYNLRRTQSLPKSSTCGVVTLRLCTRCIVNHELPWEIDSRNSICTTLLEITLTAIDDHLGPLLKHKPACYIYRAAKAQSVRPPTGPYVSSDLSSKKTRISDKADSGFPTSDFRRHV